jgi:probable addiction module antidote protein
MAIDTLSFDASEFLDTEESQAELLAHAFDTGQVSYIVHALGVVAKAKGMSGIAKQAGVTREALYKAPSEKGNPKLSTLSVAAALGYKFLM